MNARGFSLVEVLVATMVLTVGSTALVQLLLYSARANQLARATTMETLLAAEKLEDLRSEPGLMAGGSLTLDVSGYSDSVDGYARRWSVAILASGRTSAFVLRVTVRNSLPGNVSLLDIATRPAGAP